MQDRQPRKTLNEEKHHSFRSIRVSKFTQELRMKIGMRIIITIRSSHWWNRRSCFMPSNMLKTNKITNLQRELSSNIELWKVVLSLFLSTNLYHISRTKFFRSMWQLIRSKEPDPNLKNPISYHLLVTLKICNFFDPGLKLTLVN